MLPTVLQTNIINKAVNGTGNLVVSAAPGSGKTTTLSLVVSAILRNNPNANIVAISYTNSIKNTLLAKLDRRAHIFSMHQLGMALLRLSPYKPKWKWAEHLNGKQGTPENKYKKIFTDIISQDYNLKDEGKIAFALINECCDLLNKSRLELADLNSPDDIQRIAMKYRLNFTGVHFNYMTQAVQIGHQQYQQNSWCDFVDMIWLPIVYDCRAKPGMFIGNKSDNWVANKIDWILCDEFQDASPIIHQVIERYANAFGARLLFVGDEKQSCFAFAAADTRSMQKAKTQFNCEELPLNESFRCPSTVVDFINETFDTDIVSRRGIEGSINYIDQSDLFRVIDPGSMVLARTNAQLMQAFLQLLQNDIPARLININLKEFFEELFEKAEKGNSRLWTDIYDGLYEYQQKQTIEIRKKYSMYRANSLVEELQENIAVLLAYIGFIRPQSRQQFFDRLEDLLSNDNTSRYVSLLNVHIAKGLESENVYVLDYDKFPYIRDGMSEEDIQQEQNIYFIALSRTLTNLYLVSSTKE